MTKTDQDLRAIHAQACAAVFKADRTITPIDDAFWPLYLQAVLTLDEVTSGDLSNCGEDGKRRHY